jgi:hypothetical protein
MLKRISIFAVVFSSIALATVATVEAQVAPVKNIVLVHGA